MKWFWGLLFFVIGLIILGINLSWWSSDQVSRLVIFWPVILIIFGVSLIFRRARFGWLIILLIFILCFVGILDILTTNIVFKKNIISNNVVTTPISIEIPSDISKAKLIIKTGASSLKISGGSEKLITGSMESSVLEPDISYSYSNTEAEITISSKNFQPRISHGKNNLNLKVTNNIPVVVEIDAGATSMDLDFTEVRLSGLTINSGASSMKIKLGNPVENNAKIEINAGASSMEINAPIELGLKVRTESGLTGKDFPNLQKIDNQNYISQNYDNSQKKIDIIFKAGASSIKIRTN